MKLGLVVDGHWGFIRDLLSDWQTRYQTHVFSFREIHLPVWRGRVNQRRLRQSLGRFLESHDVVFFEWAGPLLVLASHLQNRSRLVVRLHSYELFDYAAHVNWKSVSQVILVSHAMRRHFLELYPAMAERSTVVYNGVALGKFARAERPFAGVIGMLGNVIPIKRIYEVVLALYELNRAGSRLTLRIAGPPDQGADPQRYYMALQRAVRQLGLENQVSLVGPVSDAAGFLKDVDIFVSNSYWEGQQVSLLEAMATGCYCLSHFWDGAEEVLPPDNLFVTDSELRAKITAFCQAPETVRHEQQERMRAIARDKFDIERAKTQLRGIIEAARPTQF